MWGGAGNRLPTAVLTVSGVSTFVAVFVSACSIGLQLKNYRKPTLQRMVVRIMVMVPIYAISSLISLFSLEAAFFIDAIRDIYEAFVIYCFFVLLLYYMGGERQLLIMLHGRPPKDPPFPMNLFRREIDVSDPYTFLFLKRGILQYVQVKPVLALVTLILKATNHFHEGNLSATSGYLYISIVYNISICLSLYCLAIFWICINDDLKPFRPVPKFLCVKGILFFSFWQSMVISILVAAGVIRKLGPYTDDESISLGLTDILITIEMPFFAFAHMFAFSYTDFMNLDHPYSYVARMPFYYAFRDAFGLLDVIEDTKATLHGEGMDYRAFEPSEGFIHQGMGRDRRIRAGLRYVGGGKGKYWLPKRDESSRLARGVNRLAGGQEGVHAPLLADQADRTVHLAPDLLDEEDEGLWEPQNIEDGFALPFGDLDAGDEELFDHSRQYVFGDYNYPTIDVSSEDARTVMWDEEERILRDERGAWFSPIRGAKGQAAMGQRHGPVWEGYGATSSDTTPRKAVPIGDRKETRRVNAGRRESAPNSVPPSPHSKPRPGFFSGPSSSEGSSSAAHRSRWSISRNNSGQPETPVIQSDAVDLVVEDTTEDQRKGESGLRRVYNESEESSPVEAEPPDVGEITVQTILDAGNEATSEEESVIEPLREVVTELESPGDIPAYKYNNLDDNNPWA
ncbi:DUF300 domain-containing protein [Mycena floridula]|nr:DUF300 domain-containing protein [Mycena floridula]